MNARRRRRANFRNVVSYALMVALIVLVIVLVGAHLAGFYRDTVGATTVIAGAVPFLLAGGIVTAVSALREVLRP